MTETNQTCLEMAISLLKTALVNLETAYRLIDPDNPVKDNVDNGFGCVEEALALLVNIRLDEDADKEVILS